MLKHKSVLAAIPPPAEVHSRLGQALREVVLLRALLRLAKRAENFRQAQPQRVSPCRAQVCTGPPSFPRPASLQ
jgi:hypothetical protein